MVPAHIRSQLDDVELRAQRIIDNHPPLTGPRGVFDMSPGRYKRRAAAIILYMRRNRRTLQKIGRSPDAIGRTHRQLLDGVAIHRMKAMEAAQGTPPFRVNVIDGGRTVELGGASLYASVTHARAAE